MDDVRVEVNKEKQELLYALLSKTTFIVELATKRESIMFAKETIGDLLESKKEIVLELARACNMVDVDADPNDED